MKTLDRIPKSKIQRASKLVKTGAQVGVNYVKYFGDRLVDSEQDAKSRLDERNAEDIYDSLKELKGSALKVAQMLSMEKSLLPRAYVERFSLAQFSVPSLSPALVDRTFRKYFGQAPSAIFDEFDLTAVHAASIGQVHRAKIGDKTYAVKIQYPGVAESISSDLALVKPIALMMFNIPSKDSDVYFSEVEDKLLEETDYENELSQSQEIAEASSGIGGLRFPSYYPQYSSKRILTMDWMEGSHLSQYVQQDHSQETRNRVGQSLWDFYMFQIHSLRKVHADPHPGNFLVSDKDELVVLDFGCVKSIPQEFYDPYFEICKKEVLDDPEQLDRLLYELEILRPSDSQKEILFFTELFYDLLSVTTRPFHQEEFDFSDHSFFEEIARLGQRYASDQELRKMNANRGSKHFIYLNRAFFGLYNLLYDLKANRVAITFPR